MAITVTQAFKDAQKGAVDRTQTKVEVYFSGVLGWVDITAYVEEWSTVLEEAPPGGRASANTLNLTLINNDGRFSPDAMTLTDGAAAPYAGNLLPNKPIRVSTVYGSESVREFTGLASNWIPSAAARLCQVTAEDTARILIRKDIVEETIFNDAAPTAGYYLTRIIERAAWLSGLRWDTANTKTDNGQVLTIAITSGGSGYSSAPTIAFSGGGGSSATAIATIKDGKVTAITISNPGSGYTSAPAVSFSGGGGTGAAATAAIVTSVWAASTQDATSITVNKSAGATRATYTLAGSLVMTLDLVDLLLPVSPLKGKCLAVLQQVADVAGGVVFFDQQGQFVFRSRMYRNDSTLASVEAVTVDNLEDVTAQTNYEDSKFAPLVNRAAVRSTPWAFKVDAAGSIEEEEIPFKGDLFQKFHFSAGERYPDYVANPGAPDLYCEIPSGIRLFKTASYPAASNMVLTSMDDADITKKYPPFSPGIAFQPGFPVFEQTRVKVALVNDGSVAQRIEQLTLTAKLMRPIQRCQSIQKNQDSIDRYDQRDKEIANDLIPNAGACKNLAAWTVEDGRTPKKVYTIRLMHGCSWLELGDKITMSETVTNTIPVATDAIVRRIMKRWTIAAVIVTIEACSPSPDFTAGAIPATVTNVETANQNMTGQQSGQLPPQTIDGTQNLVGLNNIPVFAPSLSNPKKLTGYSPALTNCYQSVYNGSDLFVNAGNFTATVLKINTMTGAMISSLSFYPAGGPTNSEGVSGFTTGNDLIFVSGTNKKQIYVATASTFSVNAVKANLNAAGFQPVRVLAAGGKLYAVCNSASVTRLMVWNSLTATQQDTPDAFYDFGAITGRTASYLVYDMVYDGRYVWIALENVLACFDASTSTLTTTAITSPTGGQYLQGVTHDGINLWASDEIGNILRFTQTVNGWVLSQAITASALYSAALFFDGTYVWASAGSVVYQISTNGAIIATYSTNGTRASQPSFDGLAVWVPNGTDSIYRIPRLVTGRQF